MDLNQLNDRLKADCTQCAALCCVSFAFEKSNAFPIDKDSGEACRNLDSCGLCRIHPVLMDEGFKGCVQFDCRGAGPLVTQELFSGASWQGEPQFLKPMMDAFWLALRLQEQVLLLRHAANLPLPEGKQAELQELLERLCPDEGWNRDTFDALDHAAVAAEVKQWLASLRAVLVS